MRVLVLLLMASLSQAQSGIANGLYYEVAGSGHPLVFIHGGQLDSRMWDDQFAAYAKSYRVIRYDVRGFGKSPAPSSVFAIDLMLTHPDLVDMEKPAEFDRAVLPFLHSQ
jgi:pimeloyl-ACP methyl ester carboxylesterase